MKNFSFKVINIKVFVVNQKFEYFKFVFGSEEAIDIIVDDKSIINIKLV